MATGILIQYQGEDLTPIKVVFDPAKVMPAILEDISTWGAVAERDNVKVEVTIDIDVSSVYQVFLDGEMQMNDIYFTTTIEVDI